MDIRNDRQKGLSYVELGNTYHMAPRAAKRYAESPEKPEYTLSEPKPTKMDPYKQLVDEWLEEAPHSAVRILEKLREMGFNGGYDREWEETSVPCQKFFLSQYRPHVLISNRKTN